MTPYNQLDLIRISDPTPILCDDLLLIAYKINEDLQDVHLSRAILHYTDHLELYAIPSKQIIDEMIEACYYALDGSYRRDDEFFPHPKRSKLNEQGEDIYLNDDGSITRYIDSVIKCQRIWKERAYQPGGKMYLHIRTHYYSIASI